MDVLEVFQKRFEDIEILYKQIQELNLIHDDVSNDEDYLSGFMMSDGLSDMFLMILKIQVKNFINFKNLNFYFQITDIGISFDIFFLWIYKHALSESNFK